MFLSGVADLVLLAFQEASKAIGKGVLSETGTQAFERLKGLVTSFLGDGKTEVAEMNGHEIEEALGRLSGAQLQELGSLAEEVRIEAAASNLASSARDQHASGSHHYHNEGGNQYNAPHGVQNIGTKARD